MCDYLYCSKYWQPQVQQKLVFRHEKGNPYDFFAIIVADIASGMIVGHLPIENSSVTKFILNKGAASSCDFDVNQLLQISACSGRLRNTLLHCNTYTFNCQELCEFMKSLLILFTTNVKKPTQFFHQGQYGNQREK